MGILRQRCKGCHLASTGEAAGSGRVNFITRKKLPRPLFCTEPMPPISRGICNPSYLAASWERGEMIELLAYSNALEIEQLDSKFR